MTSRRWSDAAREWEKIGMPYDQALAIAERSEDAQREALAILDKLGAGPLAGIVRKRLRERGVRSTPRGPNEKTRANPAGLTPKKIDLLILLAEGRSNSQLAHRLHRSTKTIDHHVSVILEKLGARSGTEAVSAGFNFGLIPSKQGDPLLRAK